MGPKKGTRGVRGGWTLGRRDSLWYYQRCAWWLDSGQERFTVVFPSIRCSAYKNVDEATDIVMRRQELMYCVILFCLKK